MLQPDFSLMELLQPYQKKMLRRRLSPARQMRKARREARLRRRMARDLTSALARATGWDTPHLIYVPESPKEVEEPI